MAPPIYIAAQPPLRERLLHQARILRVLSRTDFKFKHIYRADAGSVRVNGRLSPFIEIGVGFNYELSARENVEINGMLLGLTRAELAERFDAIIEFAELPRFVDQQLKNFSSGMLLRLAYAIAIQVPFDILLLDEVLAVGDERFREKCFATFEEIRGKGKTVVFVSHDLGSITRFCDRALCMSEGTIQRICAATEAVAEYCKQPVRGRASYVSS